MKLQHWVYIVLTILGVWFLYVERGIFTPFILAGIFAYIFNPAVNFFSKKLHLPRTIGIIVIYTLILAVIVLLGALLLHQVTKESLDLNKIVTGAIDSADIQAKTLPDWLQPTVRDFLTTFKHSRFLGLVGGGSAASALPSFSRAVSRVISFFVFLFSGYYFLQDGESTLNRLLSKLSKKYKVDVEILLRKINAVLGDYLRGQFLLIFLMSIFTYVALVIIGIKFAITLAIFSGIAEIVPVIGPITAGAVAVTVTLLTGQANFALAPFNAALLVVIVYFILRQLEDYLIIPHVMHKVTKLHPFLIFFAVVAGGHIAGVLGLLLAVPTAAVLRLILIFIFDKILEEKVS